MMAADRCYPVVTLCDEADIAPLEILNTCDISLQGRYLSTWGGKLQDELSVVFRNQHLYHVEYREDGI